MMFFPGCCCGGKSCFFVVDTTGSMGSTISTLKPGFKALVDDFPDLKFGVADYKDIPATDPRILQECTDDGDAVKAALDMYSASGGGDTDENFTQAIVKVSEQWSDYGCGRSGVIILCGDAKSHTNVYSIFDAIDAMSDANLKLLGLNTGAAGAGIDGAGQASSIIAAVGGQLFNSVLSTPYELIRQAVEELT